MNAPSNASPVECKIPCDICGKSPAQWWGATSASTCGDEKCNAVHEDRYQAGIVEAGELERFQQENGYV